MFFRQLGASSHRTHFELVELDSVVQGYADPAVVEFTTWPVAAYLPPDRRGSLVALPFRETEQSRLQVHLLLREAATQGRAFWSFDGLPHLRQLQAEQATEELHVFTPVPVAQWPSRGDAAHDQGHNPDSNLHVRFFLGGDEDQPVTDEVEIVVRRSY